MSVAATVYFDTGEAIRVFQREAATVLPRFGKAVRAGRLSLVRSEAVLIEVLKSVDAGGSVAGVRVALERMEAVAPRWLLLYRLQEAEVRQAVADRASGTPFRSVTPLMRWKQAAEQLTRERGVEPPASLPGLLDEYPRGARQDGGRGDEGGVGKARGPVRGLRAAARRVRPRAPAQAGQEVEPADVDGPPLVRGGPCVFGLAL